MAIRLRWSQPQRASSSGQLDDLDSQHPHNGRLPPQPRHRDLRGPAEWQRRLASRRAGLLDSSRGLTGEFSFETDSEAKPQDGSVSFAPGRIGRAASFDGKAFLDAGKAANFDIDDQFTLSAWIYSDSTPDGSVMSRMVDDPKGKGFGVHFDQGKLYVNITSNWDDDAIRLETEQVFEPKQWHQVTVTYSGSRMAEGIHVYVDGQPAKRSVLLDTLYRPFRNAGAFSGNRFESALAGDRSAASAG